MPTIHMPGINKVIECEEDANLYEILAAQGLFDAPCGGRGICGKCAVYVGGMETLSCLHAVNEDIIVQIPQELSAGEIVTGGYRKEFLRDSFDKEDYGVALDVGTTTVVAALVELASGREISALSCLNTQKAYGQDVISRIHYAVGKPEGLRILQQSILGDIRHLLQELNRQNNIPAARIKKIIAAGNPTMIHLLLGINPHSIARAPYQPAFTGAVRLQADKLHLPAAEDCLIYCLPAAAAFVGGDIIAGIIACDLPDTAERVLFIDIGTNGEIVLSDGGRISCCSCAAGPALEGMNISCGMRAQYGAIEDVLIENGQVRYTTIGDVEAKGICGSGILAAVAEMRRSGILHDSGRLLEHPLVQKVNDKKCFVLDNEKKIYLTQKDIRQVQLAKGAILSGIRALLKNKKVETGSVERVIVAGQFGAHLKVESLTGAGILPEEWLKKIEYAGNTSKAGAYICLLAQAQCHEAERIAADISYTELSAQCDFENLFVQSLNF